MHCFSPTRANIINTLWKHCEALQRLEPLSRKNISIFESPFEIRVFEVSWYNGVDENNLKCLENPRLFTRTPWFICSCQQCCVEISFRRNFLNLNWPRRKASFSPRQGIWIFERFLRHVWIFSGEKKTHIAYSIIPVSAGSILSCNIVAVRLVHTVWIAMNDPTISAKGNGRWWRLTIIFMRYRTHSTFGRKNAVEISRFSLSPSLPLPLYQNNRVFSIEYTDLLLNLT